MAENWAVHEAAGYDVHGYKELIGKDVIRASSGNDPVFTISRIPLQPRQANVSPPPGFTLARFKNTELTTLVRSLQQDLEKFKTQLDNTTSELRNTTSELRNTTSELRNTTSELRNTKGELAALTKYNPGLYNRVGSTRTVCAYTLLEHVMNTQLNKAITHCIAKEMQTRTPGVMGRLLKPVCNNKKIMNTTYEDMVLYLQNNDQSPGSAEVRQFVEECMLAAETQLVAGLGNSLSTSEARKVLGEAIKSCRGRRNGGCHFLECGPKSLKAEVLDDIEASLDSGETSKGSSLEDYHGLELIMKAGIDSARKAYVN